MMAIVTEVRTDGQIHGDVLSQMKRDVRLQPAEIQVSVKDGVVTLTSWVDSYVKKWAASAAAHRVRGVRAVANDIQVRLAGERTDADIAAAAVRTLECDALVPIDRLDVTVSNGCVTLSGEVDWQCQKSDAERVVRCVSGVKGLSNQIIVRPRLVSPDLKQKVEDALVRNVKPGAERIQVQVRGSKVILEGSALSWNEREEAERVAWLTPGVTSVQNQITIDY